MSTLNLEQRITKIEARNKIVEINKAWETSITRKITLIITTYFVIALTLFVIKNPDPWINAIIPSIGFFLSTLTLPFVKTYWRRYFHKS